MSDIHRRRTHRHRPRAARRSAGRHRRPRQRASRRPEEREFYSLDFSEEGGAIAMAVVRPSTAEQVAEVVRVAGDGRRGGQHPRRRHVVHQGPRAGAAGNDHPRRLRAQSRARGQRRRSLRHARDRRDAGSDLRAALRGTGFRVPYLGTLSGNWATVGGGLSQNATGMGRMTLAEHVLGLEVVLGDGRILRTGSWATKNTAPFYRYNGPDLTGMFLCDSGAFGIKTKVHLLLEPWPRMSFGCVTFPDRVSLVRAQAAMAQTGLQTEAFAFDGRYLNEYAQHPAAAEGSQAGDGEAVPRRQPEQAGARTVTCCARGIPRGSASSRGCRTRCTTSPRRTTRRPRTAWRRASRSCAASFGGRMLPTDDSVRPALRPYINVGDIMANRDGEVKFPINAKFPASKAVAAMQAFEAFVAREQGDARPARHPRGLQLRCCTATSGASSRSSRGGARSAPIACATRPRIASNARSASWRTPRPPPRRSIFAIASRACSATWGRCTCSGRKRIRSRKRSPARPRGRCCESLKDVTDPRHTLNPGVLGLGLEPRSAS